MIGERFKSASMVKKFTREYLFISLIPVMVFFLFALFGMFYAQNYIAGLIRKSIEDISAGAQQHIETHARAIIRTKAADVAGQVRVYLDAYPDLDMIGLQSSPYFRKVAMQNVGETGYTCLYEAGSGVMRIHPNPELLDREMRFLADTLPSWWEIFKTSLAGTESSGYYDWIDANGEIRKKYMVMYPVGKAVAGRELMVAATTYIDEFSAPVKVMRQKAADVSSHYRRFIEKGWGIAGAVTAVLLFATYLVVFLLGKRSALRHMMPIVRLSRAAKRLGEGDWGMAGEADAIPREGEIGELVGAFDNMKRQLKIAFNDLERRVAELKSTRDALKTSERLYRSLFDGVPVGLYRADADGRIIEANAALVNMLKYPDKKTFLSYGAKYLFLNLTDDEKWKPSNGDADGGAFETRMPCYDGSPVWVEIRSSAVLDASGGVAYIEGSLNEITARKTAEAALEKSRADFEKLYEEAKRAEELYRSLLHSSADAIVIYDLRGRVKYLSPVFTKLFGWTFEELKGRRIPFVPDSEQAASYEIIRNVVDKGELCHGFETRRYTKDGRLVDISISGSRFEDHEGNPAGMLVILRDISERKRMEEQLLIVQRMESIATLAGGVAHDFNNLMMGIMGNVSLALNAAAPDSVIHKKLNNIEKLVKSGSRLTGQLLGYARKGKYEIKTVDLNAVLQETVETFGRTRKEITVHFDTCPEKALTRADQTQIEQVLFNLYINAADAMPGGGDIWLRTGHVTHREMRNEQYAPAPGRYVMLEVTDTGAGMDPETRKRIFDPFFTTKKMGRGTGLGLASVYGIVKSHNGYIDVASDAGKGATFRIYLPASEDPAAARPEAPAPVRSGKGTVMLVDDEEMILETCAEMIEKMGYEVMPAGSGEKALDMLTANGAGVDLVILDLVMPGMGGEKCFHEMKKRKPDLKVLLSSGYSMEGQTADIMAQGCDGFIQKPYTMASLSEKINEVLRG